MLDFIIGFMVGAAVTVIVIITIITVCCCISAGRADRRAEKYCEQDNKNKENIIKF